MEQPRGTDPLLIVFVHNPRTAGTTLRGILGRNYEGAIHSEKGSLGKLRASPQLSDGRIRMLVQGHAPLGIHNLIDRPYTYITMLRRPVDRVVSLYFYLRQRARVRPSGDILRAFLTHASLEEFVSSGLWEEVDNGQTRRISGLKAEFGHCSSEMLEVAKENLRKHFSVVGITERFDETLLLLRMTLGWRYLLYRKLRVYQVQPEDELPSQETLRTIARLNELDSELYRDAADLLQEAVSRDVVRFQRDLKVLHRANKAQGNLRADVFAGSDGEPRGIRHPLLRR